MSPSAALPSELHKPRPSSQPHPAASRASHATHVSNMQRYSCLCFSLGESFEIFRFLPVFRLILGGESACTFSADRLDGWFSSCWCTNPESHQDPGLVLLTVGGKVKRRLAPSLFLLQSEHFYMHQCTVPIGPLLLFVLYQEDKL